MHDPRLLEQAKCKRCPYILLFKIHANNVLQVPLLKALSWKAQENFLLKISNCQIIQNFYLSYLSPAWLNVSSQIVFICGCNFSQIMSSNLFDVRTSCMRVCSKKVICGSLSKRVPLINLPTLVFAMYRESSASFNLRHVSSCWDDFLLNIVLGGTL